jgi:hypothetical protein
MAAPELRNSSRYGAQEWLGKTEGSRRGDTGALRHQIVAEEESEVFEFSTHHEDEDSIRIEAED